MIVFLLLTSITGILLGLKKHSGGSLLPKTQKGISSKSSDWLSLDSLMTLAKKYSLAELKLKNNDFDRIDFRPEKGIAKFTFQKSFDELQIDLTSGELLSKAKRNSDLIERIHDGSIIDIIFNIDKEFFKLIYTLVLGITLLCFTLSGFYIWYGPKSIRRIRNKANLSR